MWEPDHHSNEYHAYMTVNLADYKDDYKRGDAQDDTINDIGNTKIVKEKEKHVACIVKGLLLASRQEDLSQCKKIFYSQCNINNKIYVLIMDNGRYNNIVFKSPVRHLKLQTKAHPTLYKLGGIKKMSNYHCN